MFSLKCRTGGRQLMNSKDVSAFRCNHRHIPIECRGPSFSGIPLDVDGGYVYTSDVETHCMVCGASGRGKTRRVIYPFVVMSARAGRSLVIADMKGEIHRNTAAEVKRCGHDVKVINLRRPLVGDRYSPLALIQNYWNAGERNRAMVHLKDIANILACGVSSAKDRFWENASMDVFIGFSLLLLESGYRLSFDSVHSLANQCLSSEDNRKMLLDCLGDGSEAKRRLSTILCLEDSKTTLSCIGGTFNAMLSKYIDQEEVRDLLYDTDITFTDIGCKPTAVYLICPDESTVLYPIASLFVEQCYSELIDYADSREDNVLPVKVDFALDEFGSFVGSDWPSKLTAARSRGIRFVLALQSMSQLSDRYGVFGARTIMTNCRTLLFMGGRDIQTLSEISALSGERIDSYTGMSMPAISVTDMNRLETGDVIVLDDFGRPYVGHLPDWSFWNVNWNANLSLRTRSMTKAEHVDLYSVLGCLSFHVDAVKRVNEEEVLSAKEYFETLLGEKDGLPKGNDSIFSEGQSPVFPSLGSPKPDSLEKGESDAGPNGDSTDSSTNMLQ